MPYNYYKAAANQKDVIIKQNAKINAEASYFALKLELNYT